MVKVKKNFGEHPETVAVLTTQVLFDENGEADVEEEVFEVLMQIPGYEGFEAEVPEAGEAIEPSEAEEAEEEESSEEEVPEEEEAPKPKRPTRKSPAKK